MTPKELRDKWNLTNTQLAIALGKAEKTIKAYMCRQDTKTYRNPPLSVRLMCLQLDKQWELEGVQFIFLAA